MLLLKTNDTLMSKKLEGFLKLYTNVLNKVLKYRVILENVTIYLI